MSQWTHVAGIVRFDGLFNMGMPEPDLGFTCRFDSKEVDWDKCNVPCGSEGSLDCKMWKNPDNGDLAARTAYIFGDLRDYDNADEIIEYFNRIVEGQIIRDACYVINVEYQPIRTFTYIENEFRESINPVFGTDKQE